LIHQAGKKHQATGTC